MRMLRWICGGTKKDKISNELIRGALKVAETSSKMHERRLNSYGNVMRADKCNVGKRLREMKVPGQRRKGQPK